MRTTHQILAAGLAALASAAVSGPAHAVNHELNIDYGWQGAHDPAWDFFSDNPRIGSYGLRGGMRLSERVGVVASWGRGARGGTVYLEDPETYDTLGSFDLAFKMHQVGLGAKADLDVSPWARPYGVLMVTGMLGTVLMDDDSDEDDNANQVRYSGFGPGGFAGLGVELFGSAPEARARFVGTLEAGYAHTFPMEFTASGEDQVGELSVGDLGFNGLAIRMGAGVRF